MSLKSALKEMHFGMPATKPKAVPTEAAEEHLERALEHHKRGDHATAKKHALKAVNALHRMAPAADDAAPAGPSAPSASAAAC